MRVSDAAAGPSTGPTGAERPLDAGGEGFPLNPLWIHALWITVFLGVAGAIHNLTPGFFDGDTGYHLAVARLMREHGVLHSFPWTPFSWLADHYADKELLLHVLLVPLAGLDPNLAARIAGSLLGTALLGTLYALLIRERVARPGWWALLPLAASSAFIHRFALVRGHMLSIPLALVISWSAARRRWWVLALASFAYPLCYTAWHLPVVLIGIVEAVRLFSTRRFEWRGPVVAGCGLALGIGLHPNFPANVELFWIQNWGVLFDTVWGAKDGFEMGGEFNPFSPLGLLRYVLVPAGMAALAATLAWRMRAVDPLPLTVAVIALAFLIVTLRTQRFIEYLAPFAVFALALCWRPPRGRALAPALVGLGVLWIGLFARHPVDLLREREPSFPEEVTMALRAVVPPGEQVVTCEWHATGELMLALPERRFMVALDPVFFAMNDPEAYRLWFETVHQPPRAPATLLRDAFGARFVICDRRVKWLPLVTALRGDEAARLRGIFGLWVVYELLPDARPTASPAQASPVAAR